MTCGWIRAATSVRRATQPPASGRYPTANASCAPPAGASPPAFGPRAQTASASAIAGGVQRGRTAQGATGRASRARQVRGWVRARPQAQCGEVGCLPADRVATSRHACSRAAGQAGYLQSACRSIAQGEWLAGAAVLVLARARKPMQGGPVAAGFAGGTHVREAASRCQAWLGMAAALPYVNTAPRLASRQPCRSLTYTCTWPRICMSSSVDYTTLGTNATSASECVLGAFRSPRLRSS